MAPETVAPVLSDDQRRMVCRILDQVIPNAEVWIFGSRATGRARPFSDLDLLVTRPQRLSWDQRAALRESFETSGLPFRVDVVEAAGLASGMAPRIDLERVPLKRN